MRTGAHIIQRLAAPLGALTVLCTCTASAGERAWTRFRGPDGAGTSDATTIPVTWTKDDYNWVVPLPGVGHSSPVVWCQRIYVTCGNPDTATRSVLCLNTADGRTVWQRDFTSHTYPQHGANSYATSTPATDGKGVVVTWTTPEEVVLLALDEDGGDVWRRDLGPFVGGRGSGTSPVIVDDLVVLANDQEDPNQLPENIGRPDPIPEVGKSFLIGVDRHTGETRWKLDRRTGIAAYSTPCLYRPEGGRAELIFTSTRHGITSIDPSTGTVNWEVDHLLPERCVASPLVASGLVFASYGGGIRGTSFWAVRPGSRTLGREPAVVYEVTRSVPLVPTPVAKDDRLYLWCDDGIVTCLRLATGDVLWRKRVGGSYYSSPVCAGDYLYCVDRQGEVVVLAAAETFHIVARVPLGESGHATPAVSDGVIYFRTRSKLFSLGGQR